MDRSAARHITCRAGISRSTSPPSLSSVAPIALSRGKVSAPHRRGHSRRLAVREERVAQHHATTGSATHCPCYPCYCCCAAACLAHRQATCGARSHRHHAQLSGPGMMEDVREDGGGGGEGGGMVLVGLRGGEGGLCTTGRR